MQTTYRIGHVRSGAALQHDARQAGCVLRDDIAFRLRTSFNVSLCGGKERVNDTRAECGVGQGEPAEEQGHELKGDE